MSILSADYFHNEEAAYEFVESKLWPNGPACPKCGETERVGKMGGESTRIGTYKCYDCRKPFTVKVGTIFESSHVPLRLWLQAIFLIASSKKGISSNQLHRTLGVTLKTAWFMSHRIREAMKGQSGVLGGNGSIVEVDETFIGNKKKPKQKGRGYEHKQKVLSLVQRNGDARSFHVDAVNVKTLLPIIREQIDPNTHIMTDEAAYYTSSNRHRTYSTIAPHFASHEFVRHGQGEYGRGKIHTNTIEGFFSIFKRGMKGVYQHCSRQHLNRYLAEFDFRYNQRAAKGVNDKQRADNLLKGVVGKRLTYETAN